MSQARLEIKILKDSDQNDVRLTALSLDAAQSFLKLLESVTKIVELTPDNKDIKIQITSGSAVIAAEGEKVSKAKKEFDKILQNKSRNKELVEQWRRIQNVFTANGLQYEACFFENGTITPVYDALKVHQKLRTKPQRKNFKTNLEFIAGKLIAVGGKSPNIHVEVNGKSLPPIGCTELNATKAKAYLYQTIRFSAFAKDAEGNKRYVLCDSYATEEIFEELKSIVATLFEKDQIEMLKMLHYQCRHFLDNQSYGRLRKFLRLFINEGMDINIVKTILIVMQSFAKHDQFREMIEAFQQLYQKRFKELRKLTV